MSAASPERDSAATTPKATGRGGGKVILLGEHAVVHGRPALAAGLSRGAVATIESTSASVSVRKTSARFTFAADGGSTLRVTASSDEAEPNGKLPRALAALLATYGDTADHDPGLELDVRLELPGGAGLGASAALGVAIAAALDAHFGLPDGPTERAHRTLAWERVFHGNPSGVDNTMAAVGGVALYVRGEPLISLRMRRRLPLVVAHSGESSETHAMVAMVGRQFEREPVRVGEVFDAIASVVRNGRLAAEAGDLRALGQLMDMNQSLASALMLSNPALEEICAAARTAGALGAKLTGAGGGGCAIALAASMEEAEAIAAAVRGAGYESFTTEVGRLETAE